MPAACILMPMVQRVAPNRPTPHAPQQQHTAWLNELVEQCLGGSLCQRAAPQCMHTGTYTTKSKLGSLQHAATAGPNCYCQPWPLHVQLVNKDLLVQLIRRLKESLSLVR